MNPNHTAGPWSINDWPHARSEISIGAAGTPRVAIIPLRDVSINEQKANARRIVACVNFCGNVETEKLEMASLASTISDACRLREQRDELLALLQEALSPFQSFNNDETNPAWVSKARAATAGIAPADASRIREEHDVTVATLKEIADILSTHPDAHIGNKIVHFAYQKALAALANAHVPSPTQDSSSAAGDALESEEVGFEEWIRSAVFTMQHRTTEEWMRIAFEAGAKARRCR